MHAEISLETGLPGLMAEWQDLFLALVNSGSCGLNMPRQVRCLQWRALAAAIAVMRACMPAVGEWAPTQLAAQLGSRLFKVTKPSGGSMRMAMAPYLAYCAVQHDEEPAYVFDA
jgi:hypothetical protein